uniref:Uncharacterized protein n=1 Tax=Tortanus dextrilobatus TaxID=207953 RepID=A0A0U2MAK8_9MAXI|nr:hypothetical protein [Tortanus dextrilobatus]
MLFLFFILTCVQLSSAKKSYFEDAKDPVGQDYKNLIMDPASRQLVICSWAKNTPESNDLEECVKSAVKQFLYPRAKLKCRQKSQEIQCVSETKKTLRNLMSACSAGREEQNCKTLIQNTRTLI